MAEPQRSAALASFATQARSVQGREPVALEALPFRGTLMLRGDAEVAARTADALGCPLPERLASCRNEAASVLWLGPDAWLVLTDPAHAAELAERLRRHLAGLHHALVEVSDRFVGIAVSGIRSRDVLNAGCPLDLHPRSFPGGAVARSVLGKATVVLWRPQGDDRFELLVDRSIAPYAWLFLENAAREHGYRVIG